MSCASSKYHLLERYLGVLYLIKAETRTTRTTPRIVALSFRVLHTIGNQATPTLNSPNTLLYPL